jgi:hypothetical protein
MFVKFSPTQDELTEAENYGTAFGEKLLNTN